MRILALTAVLAASSALAQTSSPEAPTRLLLNTFTVVRLNPIGLDQQATVSWKNRLGSSEELLWKSQHYSLNAMGTINPAVGTVQGFAVIEPIAVLSLKIGGEYRWFFGGFGNVVSSPGTQMQIDKVYLDGRKADEYGATGYNLYAEPTLQAKFGPIAVRNSFNVGFRGMGLRSGDGVYYDSSLDLLLPSAGVLLQNTALALYLADRFVAGLRYEYQSPLALPGQDVHRAGALFAYTFWDNSPSMWRKGTALAMVHWDLKDRANRGLVPTFVVGFSTESDLVQ